MRFYFIVIKFNGKEYETIEQACSALQIPLNRYIYVKYKLNLTETTDIINYCLTHTFKSGEHLKVKGLKRHKSKATSVEDLRLYITGKK